MNRHSRLLFALTLLVTFCLSAPIHAADWPQFRGPGRDGVSTETGLAESWPEGGPEVLWRKPLGSGFSGVAVVEGRAFVLFGGEEDEHAAALDAATGEEIWSVDIGPLFEETFGNGPRATPTVVDGRVYALASTGRLHALSTATGEALWSVDLVETHGANVPRRGFGASPLVEDGLVLVESGAGQGKAIFALDADTGELRWSSLDMPGAGYASPIRIVIDGAPQYVVVPTASDQLVALTPEGKVAWTHSWAGGTIASPVFVPPNGVFVSATADVGGMLVRIKATEGDTFEVEEVWRDRGMKNHFSSSILVDGYIYGFDNGTLKCIEAETGTTQWVRRGYGKGSLLIADGLLFVLSDRGKLALAKATAAGFEEVSSVQLFTGKSWTAPSLADGRLLLRDLNEIVALNVRATATASASAGGDE